MLVVTFRRQELLLGPSDHSMVVVDGGCRKRSSNLTQNHYDNEKMVDRFRRKTSYDHGIRHAVGLNNFSLLSAANSRPGMHGCWG